MKKIFSMLLIFFLLPVLTYCVGNSSDPAATTTGAVDLGTPDSTPEFLPSVALTVAGNDLSGYTVVYADTPYSAAVIEKFTTEYDFFRLIAEDISEKIHAQTGVRLPVSRDSETEVRDLEILVGPTNRPESDVLDGMDVYKTCVKVDGQKLVVGGGYDSTVYTGNLRKSYCFAATYHAWDAVQAELNRTANAGGTSLDLPTDANLSKTVDLITVACIGDSITEGAKSTERDYHGYPAVLGRILWKDHLVINLGNSGKTMRDDLPVPYRGTTPHAAMKRYSQRFDYALIMLGTNDSYYDRSWPASSDEKYLTSAENLVNDLTAKNDDVQIVIMNCPVYYGTNGSGSAKVRRLQNQLPELLSAKGIKTAFFDMHKFTAEEIGSRHFPDQLHPDDTGHAMMAKAVAGMLRALEDGSYTYTLPEVTD